MKKTLLKYYVYFYVIRWELVWLFIYFMFLGWMSGMNRHFNDAFNLIGIY